MKERCIKCLNYQLKQQGIEFIVPLQTDKQFSKAIRFLLFQGRKLNLCKEYIEGEK